ncbi:hypothetical protein ACFQ0M_40005 [Kitasatospora aburaviensis]
MAAKARAFDLAAQPEFHALAQRVVSGAGNSRRPSPASATPWSPAAPTTTWCCWTSAGAG